MDDDTFHFFHHIIARVRRWRVPSSDASLEPGILFIDQSFPKGR